MTKRASIKSISQNDLSIFKNLIFSAWTILLFIILNIEIASLFHDYLPKARFTSISILWTMFSVVLMIKGFKANSSTFRKISLGLFSITLIKVFLFDMSRFSTPYRIISFIILGLVLVSTSYLYHRFKDKIINAIKSDNKGE
jgi:uncharacterized membrane protein